LKKKHKQLINLMKKVREIDGLKHLFISSGIRMDIALTDKKYTREFVFNHVSGEKTSQSYNPIFLKRKQRYR